MSCPNGDVSFVPSTKWICTPASQTLPDDDYWVNHIPGEPVDFKNNEDVYLPVFHRPSHFVQYIPFQVGSGLGPHPGVPGIQGLSHLPGCLSALFYLGLYGGARSSLFLRANPNVCSHHQLDLGASRDQVHSRGFFGSRPIFECHLSSRTLGLSCI